MSCLWPRTIVNRRYSLNHGSLPVTYDDFRVGILPPDYYVTIPCGTCPECRKAYKSQWTSRLLFEASHQAKRDCIFVSLTFSDEHLKRMPDGRLTGYDRSECAAIFRRFRDNFRKKYHFSFRYFCVSELGGKNGRFHLHAIIWAKGFSNKRIKYNDFKSLWKYGYAYVEPIRSYGAFNYISKYILKPPEFDPYYKPVVLCSPGIGYDAVRANKDYDKAFFSSSAMFTFAGYTYRVPVYYRRKFLSPLELMHRSWRLALTDHPPSLRVLSMSFRDLDSMERYVKSYRSELIAKSSPYVPSFVVRKFFNEKMFLDNASSF